MALDFGSPRFRRRRPHRLPHDAYTGGSQVWHVTIGAADRSAQPFAVKPVAESIVESLLQRCRKHQASLLLYCLMPDHLHLIVQMDSGNLLDMINEVKSVTTRGWWKHGGSGRLWQPSYHDHGIRDLPDFETIFAYVLDNPVRAGLVESWEEYPFTGGELIEEP